MFIYSMCFFAWAGESANQTKLTSRNHEALIVGLPYLEGDSDLPIEGLRDYLESFWRDWGQAYQHKIEFYPVNLQSAANALQEGQVDILATSFYQASLAELQYVSIPYVTFSGALYRQYASATPAKSAALHIPLAENGFDNPFHLTKTANFCELISDESDIDLIYSWAPWLASEELKKLPRGMRFHKLQKAAPKLHMRAAVTHDNRDLILEINQFMRSFDSARAKRQWQEHFSDSTPFFDTALGDYATDLPAELQHYIADNPISSYAYFDGGFPPYLIQGETQVVGYIPDLLNSIASRTGLTFQAKRFGTVNQAIDGIKSQQVDLLSNLFKTPQREREMLFSQPFDNSMTVIVSNRHDQFLGFHELRDKVIVAAEGTQVSKKLRLLHPNEQILLVDTMDDALLAVAEGAADAFIGNGLNASFKIHKLNLGHLAVNKPQGFDNDQLYYFGVDKGKPQLNALIDIGLHSIGDLELDQLHQKWVSSVLVQGADKRYETLYRQVSTTGLIALLIALFVGTAIHIHLKNLRKTKVEVIDALAQAEKSREHAEVLARAKTDFLARMSHEIRTPMNGVLGMAEALSYTKLNLEQKDLLDTLNGSAQNLMALLNDVLDFSKMDAGKLTVELTPVSLNGVLTNVIDNFRHKAKSSGLALNLRIDKQLSENYLTDPTRMMQLLNNLISNSIKFTSSGFIELSAQLLSVDSHEPSSHTIRIDVRDTGIGIDKDKVATLFDPFTQAEGDTTRRFGGTGLGLSICKEISEALGGEIKVTSMPGKGSLFSLILSLTRTDEAGLLHSKPDEHLSDKCLLATFSNLNILLAEDNPVNRKVIGGQLARLGLEVDQAENGLIAYQMYQQGDYDIIISDCHMPEMDGFTLANLISEYREGVRPRLIAITADALSGAEQSCLSAGFDNYIAKPCPIDILEQKLLSEIDRLLVSSPLLVVTNEEQIDLNVSDILESEHLASQLKTAELNPELDDFAVAVLNQEAAGFTLAEDSSFEEKHALIREGSSDVSHVVCPPLEMTSPFFVPNHLLELSGDDKEIAIEILEVYLAGTDEDIRQVQLQLENADYRLLKDIAHRIKGSVRYLGAAELGDLTQCLEIACNTEDSTNVQTLCKELITGLETVKCEVVEWLAQEVNV
ncbi:ATP-binding protein [Shewanella sp. UCD-KL12]|uniref:ATP-binding protein n=1 Tax=Shewanella sp. UCD-KL12 TaxID=1917163 RepID=UPI0015C39960|nr:transporter substrate-binding domain-containing protein [Shewanella sp. UCD-KL12]